jgi:hypothetical protein
MKSERKPLAAAFAAALAEMPSPTLDKTNSAFGKFRYASIGSYLETCRPHLARFGLAMATDYEPMPDGNLMCWTVIRDETGETLRLAPVPVKVDLVKPQATGSAMTYARRYSISAALGVVGDEDDDGNAASVPEPKRSMSQAIATAAPTPAQKPASQPAPKPVVNEDTGFEVVRIASVDTKDGTTKAGKPWRLYIVKTDGGEEFTTFSMTVGDRAFNYIGGTAEVLVQEKTTPSGKQTLELMDIKATARTTPPAREEDANDIPF